MKVNMQVTPVPYGKINPKVGFSSTVLFFYQKKVEDNVCMTGYFSESSFHKKQSFNTTFSSCPDSPTWEEIYACFWPTCYPHFGLIQLWGQVQRVIIPVILEFNVLETSSTQLRTTPLCSDNTSPRRCHFHFVTSHLSLLFHESVYIKSHSRIRFFILMYMMNSLESPGSIALLWPIASFVRFDCHSAVCNKPVTVYAARYPLIICCSLSSVLSSV